MKTLTTILTTAVLLTSCGNKNEMSCSKSQLTSGDASPCVCQLLAKKNTVNKKVKRSKIGMILISQKINTID